MKKRIEGNWLRKSRTNFFISAMAKGLMTQLAAYLGISLSGVVELAIRELYEKRMGPLPKPDFGPNPGVLRSVEK